MSNDKSLVRRFFNKSLGKKEKNTTKDAKIVLPPKPRKSYLGQKLDTRRVDEYERTVRAVERVVRASVDLEEAVGDLNNVDTRIATNKNKFLSELEESKQRLEGLMNNTELTEERRKAEIVEEKKKQSGAEAEIMEYEVRKAEERTKIAEAEERVKKMVDTSPPKQPQQKTRIDKINEREREIRKLREVIVKNLESELKAIEEEGKVRGLTAKEVESKKDIERARWAKIEMEELEKLERKYG